MGPSGCGKSTLLNILGLLDNPTGGKYFLNGTEVGGYTESQRTSLRKGVIGFVFQSFNLIDELNVFENIELPLLYLGVPSADVSGSGGCHGADGDYTSCQALPAAAVGWTTATCGYCPCRSIRPKLILADEPTGNLDSKNGREVMELLTELHKEGTTIVMVTHSQHDAGFADRVINLFDGQVVTEVNL